VIVIWSEPLAGRLVGAKSDSFRAIAIQEYVKYGTLMNSRVYPGGKRIESSNYNPQLMYASRSLAALLPGPCKTLCTGIGGTCGFRWL
jgi:hypothetical protein